MRTIIHSCYYHPQYPHIDTGNYFEYDIWNPEFNSQLDTTQPPMYNICSIAGIQTAWLEDLRGVLSGEPTEEENCKVKILMYGGRN